MLFIFIELGAMISIYFKTNRLSIRFLVYAAITALTSLLVIDIKAMDNFSILTITAAIVLLTLAVFGLRSSSHFFWRRYRGRRLIKIHYYLLYQGR